jgi:hypothetical protein
MIMKVSFAHDTLTPDNIRCTIDTGAVPPVGAVVELPWAGSGGVPARWRVVAQEWTWVLTGRPPRGYGHPEPGNWSVLVRCTDVTP